MPTFKQFVFASAAIVTMACAPLTTAAARGHGYGHFHGWGLGRGLLGAVVGIATLPLVIASAAIDAGLADASAYGAENYAPPRPYYPQQSYAPSAYYPRAPVYYPAPRAYYAPRAYSVAAPRQGYHGGYRPYRPGGYAYSNR